jgi:SAM-dependent methyltransferase
MELRQFTRTFAGGLLATTMRDLNARHPWSHNDHFHSWILANLPTRRQAALDVGCGRGELLAALSPHFEEVLGVDVDESMRLAADQRCAGLPNVSIADDAIAHLGGPFDLVTMVAVLHHLDIPTALKEVDRLLAPRGHFLAVGLAPPRSVRDYAWDAASIVTNPIIGLVKHPWPNRLGYQPPTIPVQEPTLTFDEVRDLVEAVMPGATMSHQLGFRHTISWVKE